MKEENGKQYIIEKQIKPRTHKHTDTQSNEMKLNESQQKKIGRTIERMKKKNN